VCSGGGAGRESRPRIDTLKRKSDKRINDNESRWCGFSGTCSGSNSGTKRQDAKARNSGSEPDVIEDAIDEALSMTRRGNAGRSDGN
jgi:hypothetical protein